MRARKKEPVADPQSDRVVVHVPAGIDWPSLNTSRPPNFAFKHEVAALLLDTILYRQGRKYPWSRRGYVSLVATYLRNIHRDYAQYLRWLEAVGLVEIRRGYCIGAQARQYRIADRFTSGVTTLTLTKRTTIKAFRRCRERAKAERARSLAENPTRFLSNLDTAKPTRIDANILCARHSHPESFPFSSFVLLNQPLPFSSRISLRRALMTFYQSHPDKIGLDPARSSLGIENVEPFSVDRLQAAVDSQLCQIGPDYWETMAHLRESLRTVRLAPEWRDHFDERRALWPSRKAERIHRQIVTAERALSEGASRFTRNVTNGRLDTALTNLPKSFRAFIRLGGSAAWANLDVTNAQPYLALKLLQEREGDAGTIQQWATTVGNDAYSVLATQLRISRDDAKTCWFRILFGHNRSTSTEKEEFERLFPDVAAYFHWEKRLHHRDLAVRLQRYESHVVLERIAPRLAQLGIPVVTIHDSLIVPDQREDETRSIMVDELTDFTGYPPQIRRTTAADG